MDNLTPRQIVEELDRYIVGHTDAKRAVAVAVRNRWRRQQLPEQMRQAVAERLCKALVEGRNVRSNRRLNTRGMSLHRPLDECEFYGDKDRISANRFWYRCSSRPTPYGGRSFEQGGSVVSRDAATPAAKPGSL